MMIIERPRETDRLKQTKKWVLVYGRRKTGKTFIVQSFIPHDEYFFVKTSKSIFSKNGQSISYETLLELLKRTLAEKKTIVIDEFHRLGEDFFDFLHYTKKEGMLILVSSTLFLSKKLISSHSALLGLFAEMPVGLVRLADSLTVLKEMQKKERMELAILLREPLAADFVDEQKRPREIFATILLGSLKTIPALTGEIFMEEMREISGIYEGILRGIAVGKVGSGELSSYLFSNKLIKRDDPSTIQQYLLNLMQFGIVRRIEIFHKKRFVYKLSSPLTRLYYYCDEKYNLSERSPREEELYPIINEMMPRLVEDNVREALAEKYALREAVMEGNDFDVDGCLMKFSSPEILLEVKWGVLDSKAIRLIEERLKELPGKRKILFVPDKTKVKTVLETADVDDLL